MLSGKLRNGKRMRKKIQTNYLGKKSNLIWRGHIKTKKLQIITDYLLRGENNQLFGGEGKQMQFLRLRSRHCNPLQQSLAFFFRLGKIYAFYSSNTWVNGAIGPLAPPPTPEFHFLIVFAGKSNSTNGTKKRICV